MKAFRMIARGMRDAFKSISRNFSLSMASIICTTITLVLVSIALIASANVNYITKSLEEELTIVVYANSDTTDEELDTIESKIEAMDGVDTVTFKSKEEWKLEMKNSSEALETTLDYLTENPLLDSFTVTVVNIDDMSDITKEIRKIDGVESANYGEGMVEEIVSVFNVVKLVTFIIVIALILVMAFLIGNTIRLTIFSRKNEIEIMRLVGSSNTYIKIPFIIEGFLLGLIGSIIPIGLTIYGYYIIVDKFNTSSMFSMFSLINPLPFVIYVSIILALIGAVVGMISSASAVKRYLKI